jgi:hypothetical protein
MYNPTCTPPDLLGNPLPCCLQSVLSSPVHTPLHDEALAVVSLHCGAGEDIPRADTLALLYQTLGVIPAYRWGGGGRCSCACHLLCLSVS